MRLPLVYKLFTINATAQKKENVSESAQALHARNLPSPTRLLRFAAVVKAVSWCWCTRPSPAWCWCTTTSRPQNFLPPTERHRPPTSSIRCIDNWCNFLVQFVSNLMRNSRNIYGLNLYPESFLFIFELAQIKSNISILFELAQINIRLIRSVLTSSLPYRGNSDNRHETHIHQLF
jgi:hypothetical protein